MEKHIAIQNTWFSDVQLLAPYGGENGVISLSGHWWLQQGTFGSDLAGFLAKTQQDVEDRLGTYLTKHPEVDTQTDSVVIADIESPHPKDLHTYSPSDQDAIVAAYRTRIAAGRVVFPNAKLGLYGTLVPDSQGRADSDAYVARLASLIEAGQEGLYDDLDHLVPVLYVRFGCDNARTGPCDSKWDTIGEYTKLGLDGSCQLLTSDGRSVPLLPLLSFRVYNGQSAFDERLLLDLGVPKPLDQTLGTQLDILAAGGVTKVALWNGIDQNLLEEPNWNSWTVVDYFRRLRRYT